MTVEEYIEKFHIDGNKSSFNHHDFLEAFANEFNSNLLNQENLDYFKFNELVFSMMDKFKAIRSIHSKKRHIKDRLWKAFFAIYVVPKRKELFPLEQERLDKKHYEQKANSNKPTR